MPGRRKDSFHYIHLLCCPPAIPTTSPTAPAIAPCTTYACVIVPAVACLPICLPALLLPLRCGPASGLTPVSLPPPPHSAYACVPHPARQQGDERHPAGQWRFQHPDL